MDAKAQANGALAQKIGWYHRADDRDKWGDAPHKSHRACLICLFPPALTPPLRAPLPLGRFSCHQTGARQNHLSFAFTTLRPPGSAFLLDFPSDAKQTDILALLKASGIPPPPSKPLVHLPCPPDATQAPSKPTSSLCSRRRAPPYVCPLDHLPRLLISYMRQRHNIPTLFIPPPSLSVLLITHLTVPLTPRPHRRHAGAKQTDILALLKASGAPAGTPITPPPATPPPPPAAAPVSSYASSSAASSSNAYSSSAGGPQGGYTPMTPKWQQSLEEARERIRWVGAMMPG